MNAIEISNLSKSFRGLYAVDHLNNTGCFPGSSVWDNLMMQAINLGLKNPKEEINRVLRIVRMEDFIKIKFKSCSLGMKQRIGIAMAMLGELEKIVTHYGILCQGKMLQEITAKEMESRARVFVSLKTKDMKFENNSFGQRLKSMVAVDFRRMFTMRLFYVMAGICLAVPILYSAWYGFFDDIKQMRFDINK